jgi:hypothetical protein
VRKALATVLSIRTFHVIVLSKVTTRDVTDFSAFVLSVCNFVHYSFFVFLCWTLFHYMFRPNCPSSGVQVVMVKDSAAHYNTVIFPPIVVVSGYFWLFGLQVVAFL